MTREQLVGKARMAILNRRGPGKHPGATEDAAAMVDAILPQVTTVEELEALPVGAQVLDGAGVVWRTWRWNDNFEMFFYSSIASLGPFDVAEIATRGPLTVVWQP